MSLHSLVNIHKVNILKQNTASTTNLDTRRTWKVIDTISCRISQVGVEETKFLVERSFTYTWQLWSDKEIALPVDTRVEYNGRILRVVQGIINAGALNRVWYAFLHEFDMDQFEIEGAN